MPKGAEQFHVLAYDFGVKRNSLRLLAERGARVTTLTLSTGNPSVGSVKPELHPWHLDFYQQPRTYYDKSRGRVAADAPAQAMSEAVLQESSTVADYVQVSQEAITTSFDISIPYTVNSTNQATAVDIGRYDLKSHFRYSAAPKLDPDAFLMAGTAGWAELNLLPGEANVFFEGTFVGKTVIDPLSVRDTLFFSLGRDHRIVVKRQRIKDYNARAIIVRLAYLPALVATAAAKPAAAPAAQPASTPAATTPAASPASSCGVCHSEKFSTVRPTSTCRCNVHEMGATCEYHGHFVSLL